MKKFIPTRIAEIIFALVIAYFGIMHIRYGNPESGVPSYMPGTATVWMYVTGAGFIAAAIAIIINKFKTLGCYLLAAMLIVFIITIHLEGALKKGDLYQLLKDVGLAMAAIIIGNNSK